MATQADPQLILVVEDDAAVGAVFRELLELAGFRVALLADPPAETAEVVAVGPDLIVLDLLFGRAPAGWEFLQRLKADPTAAVIPVLVCTADAALVARLGERLSAWSCAVVLKPFDVDRFLAVVEECFGAVQRPEGD